MISSTSSFTEKYRLRIFFLYGGLVPQEKGKTQAETSKVQGKVVRTLFFYKIRKTILQGLRTIQRSEKVSSEPRESRWIEKKVFAGLEVNYPQSFLVKPFVWDDKVSKIFHHLGFEC